MLAAVVQLTPTGDKSANRAAATQAIRAATDRGADLVVLPEAAMLPFGRPTQALTEAAEPLDGPFVQSLATAVAATPATVIAGLFEAIAGDEHVFTTIVAVAATGLLGAYRKVHLFDALGTRESDRLRAGDPTDPPLVVEVGDLTVGVLNCYDLRFPEVTRRLVDRGATLLAVPAAWVAGPLKEDHWVTLARARAIENTAYLAGAGQGPPACAGRSLIVDPMGVVVAQCGEADGMALAEVSAQRVAAVRTALPSLAHRRYSVTPGRPSPAH